MLECLSWRLFTISSLTNMAPLYHIIISFPQPSSTLVLGTFDFTAIPRLRRLGCTNLADAASTLGYTGAETVLELSGDLLERSHAAGSGSLSALGLLAPLDYANDWC